MNVHYRLKNLRPLIASTLIVVVLTACASGRGPYRRGNKAELARDYETAMNEYRVALARSPDKIEYRLKYEQARFAAAFDHFQKGRRALNAKDLNTAKTEFERAIAIDPTNDMAVQELQKVNDALQSRQRQEPEPVHLFEDMRESARVDPNVQTQLSPTLTSPISFVMTQDSRVAFETLAELAGLNIVFDNDFRGQPIPVELNNVDIYEALDILTLQTNTFWQPLNRTTILISPDNQTKRRQYEQHVLKTIYLSNSITSTEITEAITALRTLLNMRYIAQSTSVNAIIVRDTVDRIAIAEAILENIDKAKPEVLVEASLLEVDRNQLRELGILPPSGTSLTFGTEDDNTTTLRGLSSINSGSFSVAIPETIARFLATDGNSKLLQNPQLRASDGKLASIRIGSKVPVAQGSFQPAFAGATGTPVVNFTWVDVGVNLDITPRVLLNRDISLTVVVQVSAVNGERNIGGVVAPVFTNRSVQHEIRLSEGETNILAGLISNSESTSITGIPGLIKIPLLKRLFGQERKTRDDTEIIVMLTPHIVRMPEITRDNLRGLYIGTEVNTRVRPAPGAAAPPAPAPRPPAALPPGVMIGAPGTVTPPATAAAPRPTNTTVGFEAPSYTLGPQPTAINLTINGNDVFAADVTLSFDPSAISVQDIRDAGFLSRDGQIVALVQKVESQAGTARITIERPPGATPVSGNGNLVTLMLQPGARKGESVLRVVDFRLRDAQQNVYVGRPAEVRVNVP